MISLQEELDWHCYQLYGLLVEDLRYTGDDLPELALGQRAFEIVMARQMANGELETTWFDRHGSTPITEIPTHWPEAYRKLVERRIKVIETNKEIALIEKPEYKRRWNAEPWEEQEQRALKNWLLDRLEIPKYRKGTKDNPELTTTAQMADVASADAEFLQVAALYRGRPDFNVAALVAELVEGEAVPFLPILRYKPAGLRKREIWERTWELQREDDRDQTTKQTKHTKEDREIPTESDSPDSFRVFRVFRGSNSGGSISDAHSIPVPPKYASADFLKTDYWRLRGKLDVPKDAGSATRIARPTATRRSWSVGRGGITLSRRRPWSPTTTPASGKAGTPNGSRPSWRASISYCRGFTSGTPRSTKSSVRRRVNRSKRCWSTTPMNSA